MITCNGIVGLSLLVGSVRTTSSSSRRRAAAARSPR
jgi:Ca2+/H+ antiporter